MLLVDQASFFILSGSRFGIVNWPIIKIIRKLEVKSLEKLYIPTSSRLYDSSLAELTC